MFGFEVMISLLEGLLIDLLIWLDGSMEEYRLCLMEEKEEEEERPSASLYIHTEVTPMA